MTTRRFVCSAVCLATSVACCGTILASPKADAKAVQRRADLKKELLANPEKLFSNEFDAVTLRPEERKMLGVYRYLRDGRKLEDATLKQLKLTEAQKKAIQDFFKDQFAYTVETHASPRVLGGRQRDYLAPPGSRHAPVPKDTKLPNGTRAKDINRPSASPFANPQALINRVAAELPGDQMEAYLPLSEHWRVLRPQGVADGPLRVILRATMDPELQLGDKLQAECRDLLVQRMQKLGRNRRVVKKKLKAAAGGQADVAAKLTLTQRRHFENTIAKLKNEYADEIVMLTEYRAEHDKPAVKKTVPTNAKKKTAKP